MPRTLASPPSVVSSTSSGWISTIPCCSSSHRLLLPNVIQIQQTWDFFRLHLSSSSNQECPKRPLGSSVALNSEQQQVLEEDDAATKASTWAEHWPLEPTADSLNLVMSAYQEQGRLDDALRVWESFKEIGVLPNLTTYSILIAIFHIKDDARKALRLYRDARQQFSDTDSAEVSQDTAEVGSSSETADESLEQLGKVVADMCLERISNGLENGENRFVLQNLFQKMQYAQLCVCKFACRRLLLKCGEKKDDHVVLNSIYCYMRQQRVLTTSLCNHAIRVFGHQGKWWAALEVFEQMLDSGPKPNEITRRLISSHFDYLLSAAKRKNEWKWCLQLIDKMEEKGLAPGKLAWDMALVTCARAGRTAETVTLFQKMVQCKCKPDIHSYGALLSAFEKQGLVEDMKKVLKSMKNSGITPTESVYTTMISAYGKLRNFVEITRLVEEMQAAGLNPSVVTFNAIITACAKAGDAQAALSWLHKLEAANLKANANTYNKLVEALAYGGRWREAISTYILMRDLKLQPSPWAYDAVALVCRLNNVHMDFRWIGRRPRQLRPNFKYNPTNEIMAS